MASQPYDGITDKVSQRIASGLAVGQIAADRGTLGVLVVCPGCWFPGDTYDPAAGTLHATGGAAQTIPESKLTVASAP
jgi:hypothetical protein